MKHRAQKRGHTTIATNLILSLFLIDEAVKYELKMDGSVKFSEKKEIR